VNARLVDRFFEDELGFALLGDRVIALDCDRAEGLAILGDAVADVEIIRGVHGGKTSKSGDEKAELHRPG
jgi:hypothetical protein